MQKTADPITAVSQNELSHGINHGVNNLSNSRPITAVTSHKIMHITSSFRRITFVNPFVVDVRSIRSGCHVRSESECCGPELRCAFRNEIQLHGSPSSTTLSNSVVDAFPTGHQSHTHTNMTLIVPESYSASNFFTSLDVKLKS
jgi:hypothetical protein